MIWNNINISKFPPYEHEHLIVSAMSVPIVDENGKALGTVEVLHDEKGREFTDEDVEVVEEMVGEIVVGR